uniref:Cytosol aminopeptidase domain-containing protein n=1 Tax=Corethron hystrix TaxID=216773 RepID=A0A7S1BCA4_9STRA
MVAAARPSKGDVRIVVAGAAADGSQVGSLATAVARAFPLYSKKTGDGEGEAAGNVHVSFLDEAGENVASADAARAASAAAEGVRLACRLGDMPPEELTTAAFAEECRAVADRFPNTVTMTEICGDELRDAGYGGLYGVGKAAACPPRLVELSYDPSPSAAAADGTIALVGKGIVYDTGGLSIKPKEGMAGMKHDMCGAAGVLGGFTAAVRLGLPRKLRLVLCLAENAIGPDAFRNDDILTMLSGKTVEVNNCDAEGRLVLADGVHHVTKHVEDLDLVVDMATLTGAQLIATGKKHAGILANDAALERRAVDAGLRSGDLTFPLLYAPELLKDEFQSKVADMKNSVKDRMNAQTSCAGHFIEAHLDPEYKNGWLHVDMAGPGSKEERATGYGVGLVLSLLEAPGF